MLRTLQTAAHLQHAITKSVDTELLVNDYLVAKLKPEVGWINPLTHGALAVFDKDTLINDYLDGKVSSITRDPLCKLPPPPFPDKNFERRYTQGLEDLF